MRKSSMSLAVAFLCLVACSGDDHDHDDHDHDHGHDEDVTLPASCEAFHDACISAEEAGVASPAAEACHELVHKKGITEAECAAEKDECLTACGAGGTSGTG